MSEKQALRFRTAGSTEYVLRGVRETAIGFEADLARLSDHGIADVRGGGFENTVKFHEVFFQVMPTIGERFHYVHPLWMGCASSPISEFLESSASGSQDAE